MRKLRRISQFIFLFLFIYLFFNAAFPYEALIPSDVFLRADPLIAIITMITTRKFMFGMFLLALILLAATLFLGRFFCGWICPLGTLIDYSDFLTSKNRKKVQRVPKKYKFWKYSLLAGIIVAAIFSLQFIWLFDPISLITRSLTVTIYPLFSYFVEGVFLVLFKTGIFEDTVFSVYDTLHHSILPVKPVYFQQSVLIALILATILLLGIITKRFWCRYICPLGALYAVFSKYRITKRLVNNKCTQCGLCYSNCKMHAINDDFTSYSQFECIECMDCVTLCPVNAFEYKLQVGNFSGKVDITRRRLIFSGLSGLLTVGIIKTSFVNKTTRESIIRPPGSLPESEFLDRCVRCHECIKICSTTGGYLQPSLLEGGLEGIWTPRGDARHGYCEFDCTLCGQVCPTQAIHLLDVKTKTSLSIGTAQFDKNLCIPWYRNEDCIVCEEHCPVYDKAIKFEIKKVKKTDGTVKEVKYPYVVEKLCIGCGICVNKCPLEGEAGIFVTGKGQQRYIS